MDEIGYVCFTEGRRCPERLNQKLSAPSSQERVCLTPHELIWDWETLAETGNRSSQDTLPPSMKTLLLTSAMPEMPTR
jgi:hypothetical protein